MWYYNNMLRREPVTKQHIKKADIFLIVLCLLASVLSGLWLLTGRQDGTTLTVTYDGTTLYTAALAQSDMFTHDTDEGDIRYLLITYPEPESLPEITVFSDRPDIMEDTSYNLLVITDGKVYMEAADCPDQICVRHKAIAADRENIICLPHRLVVELSGALQTQDTLDGMVK